MESTSSDSSSVSLSNESQNKDSSLGSPASETASSSSSIVKGTKSKSPKGSPPNALNRFSSQIQKPSHRKTSPISWFPRKKFDSYLNRKIKLLQEAGGMNDTLDETLGHSNPHYCRVEREKIAAKEAARKVMNARKAAMVEASWCRILEAARIPSKEAASLLAKAEEEVKEAVECAIAKGVIMYDTPDQASKIFEIETCSNIGKESTTHTVKAAFETGFEVDKQVASAVKTAFIRLTHCSSFNRDEFKDLLRKISENPNHQELSESEIRVEEEHKKKKTSPQKFTGTMLIDMMLERLKCLKEDELASLATIVATCGLSAALANTEMDDNRVREKIEEDLPSLDKFLVKKMSKLEREVQEARNARKDESENKAQMRDEKTASTDVIIPDLGSSLVKRSSKLEKEIEEAKKRNQSTGRAQKHEKSRRIEEVPSLDKVLVRHVSRLEREVQEAKKNTEKENVESNVKKEQGKKSNVGGGVCEAGLDEILVKHKSRLEREKTNADEEDGVSRSSRTVSGRREAREKEMLEMWGGVGLGNSIKPHVSRLEREKAAWLKAEEEERRTVLQEQ